MEEREKVVKHMWDVYTNSRRIRLPKFWQEAFEAAYEDLTSDVPGVREAAITEIAKMSVRSIDIEPPPVQSTVCNPSYWLDLFYFTQCCLNHLRICLCIKLARIISDFVRLGDE